MDLLLPDVRVAKISPQLMDNTARFSSPLTGTVRTIARPGDRWSFQLDYQNLQGLDRARLESFIANMRGAANRVLYSPGDYVQRGSFPSQELLTNNSFSGGSSGWTVNGFGALIVADRVAKLMTTGPARFSQISLSQANTNFTPYAPYVMRALVADGAQSSGISVNTYIEDAAVSNFVGGVTRGFRVVTIVPATTGGSQFPAVIETAAGFSAGTYVLIPWCSLSRCALVDGGSNLLLNSDTPAPGGTAWTVFNATAALNGTTAPDGNLTAYYILETATTSTHYVTQTGITVSSAAADFTFSVFVSANLRSWCWLEIQESTGGTAVVGYFNLSTGALGVNNFLGTNWSNLRMTTENYGAGFWRVTITAKKTNAATTLTVFLGAATADGTQSYLGSASSAAILTWRASLAQSSVPIRSVQTISTAVPATQPTGNAFNLKGLPPSTNGLLLPGDWIEINKELKRATDSLNSDAAGLGYLQFSPPLRNPPNDNDPVIVNNPMGRFTLKNPANGWASTPLYFASSSLVLEEAA